MNQSDDHLEPARPGSSSRFGPGHFATTSWSMVIKASGDDSSSRIALEALCQAYWYPLYAFIRRKGHDRSKAEELTQSFFVFLIDKEILQIVDQQRGKFRTFLLTSLTNFITNEWRRENAAKRGGNTRTLSIDFEYGEKRYMGEPVEELSPEKIFDRSWAMMILAQTFQSLESYYQDSDKLELFNMLKPYLVGEGVVAYSELAEKLDMTPGSIKVAIHRMRTRCREELRNLIGQTVNSDSEIDEEIAELFAIFSS